jgi:transposase
MLYVLRTGCQWKMIPKEYYAGSTTHRYFQRWVKAGVFQDLWTHCLSEYDELVGIDWEWQVLDSHTVAAPVKKGMK